MFVFEVKFRFGREAPAPAGEHVPDLPAGDAHVELDSDQPPTMGFSVPRHMKDWE